MGELIGQLFDSYKWVLGHSKVRGDFDGEGY